MYLIRIAALAAASVLVPALAVYGASTIMTKRFPCTVPVRNPNSITFQALASAGAFCCDELSNKGEQKGTKGDGSVLLKNRTVPENVSRETFSGLDLVLKSAGDYLSIAN